VNRVVILSNDVVPEQGTLVAAPGLRAHGLAAGLRSAGFEVTTLVDAGAVERYRKAIGEVRAAPDVEVRSPSEFMSRLKAERPAAAVMINGNQAEHLTRSRGLRFVYDGFAPRMLEIAFRTAGSTERDLARTAHSEGRAMRLADAVIVNGRFKVGWYLAWLIHAERDVRKVPVRVVEMTVPAAARPFSGPAASPPTAVMAGYRHDWTTVPAAVEATIRAAGDRLHLVLVEGRHWGTSRPERPDPGREALSGLSGVEIRPPMPWEEFSRFLAGADLFVDLFPRTPERELAMVTRSVVALAHGLPVVHPPFTEVSPIIAGSGAGWLVDPDDPAAVERLVAGLDPAEIAARGAAAAALARGRLDPATAVRPLVEILRGFE
jgi:hypothetical protein